SFQLVRSGAALLPLALAAACGGGSSSGTLAPPPGGPAPALGLDARPSNATCIAPAPSDPDAFEIALEPVFTNLSFDQPLGMLQAPGGSGRWFVLGKGGTVRAFAADPDVATFEPDFIHVDVNASGEGGLLGMAFHPEWPADGRVFVSWT